MTPNDTEMFTTDEAARETALDRSRSFIVQAPAGSGKTELLIQRYLALLAAVDAPEEIIAITFTRKAAAEMRVRILQALRDAANSDAANSDAANSDAANSDAADSGTESAHRRRTRQLAREALNRDAAQQWSLGEQPGRLRILTIDALNGWLARQMPWLSGLGPLSSVTDDTAELYTATVRSVLLGESGGEEFRRAVRSLLVHLDNRFGTIEQLLADMLAIRDQWVGLVEGGLDSVDARALLEHTLERLVRGHLARLHEHLDAETLGEFLLLAAHAAAVLDADPDRSAAGLEVLLRPHAQPSDAAGDMPQWLAIRHLLLTDSDEYRKPKGITVRQGFATGDPMKQRLLAVLDTVREDETLRELLAGLRRLPSPAFDEGQWDIVGSIVSILSACMVELRAQFTRRGVTDHIEVATAARRALGDDLDPTELAMLLEYRIRHVLVDEFQDTSSNQFLLLQQLTAGWSAPDQHTLFLVGDPMQSIYRFREAEVGLFLQVWQQGRLGSVPLQSLRLTRNFRSQRGVVSWVNDVFARIMPPENDAAAGAVAYAPSVAVHPDEQVTTDMQVVYSGNRAEEARGVASFLRRVLDGSECGAVESVAVLVRSRAHLAELVPALRAADLRFRAVDIESLGENTAVRDLLALARALLYPADRIAWLSVLRAPWCGLTLADLHALCGDEERRPVPMLLRDGAGLVRIGDDGRRRIERLAPLLEDALALRGRLSLRALIEGCWTALGAPALLDAADTDAARAFLSLLEQHDEGGNLDDIALLEERTAMLFAPADPEGDPRLQLMTIHKAKGLQFDVVVLPRLDGVPRRESDRLLLWDRVLGEDGLDFLLAPLRQRGSVTDATYAFIRSSRTQKADYESVRLLYVAATRAKRRLFLSATMMEKVKDESRELRAPNPRSFLALLWPLLQEEIERRYSAWLGEESSPAVVTERPTAGAPLRRVPADWQPPPIPADVTPAASRTPIERTGPEEHEPGEPTRRSIRAGRIPRAVGTAVHALFARIADEGPAFWTDIDTPKREALLTALLRQAGLPSPDEDALRRASAAVDLTLADDRGRWLLRRHANDDPELALTGVDGDGIVSVKIDRTFVSEEGVRWIVDYKTSFHEGAGLRAFLDEQVELYRNQIERYARLMRKWDDRPLRAVLYFPLLQEWCEIPLPDNAEATELF